MERIYKWKEATKNINVVFCEQIQRKWFIWFAYLKKLYREDKKFIIYKIKQDIWAYKYNHMNLDHEIIER